MNASSESGLWATWMVVIGWGEGSLRSGTRCGERGVDVVPMQEVLRERGRAFRRFGGEKPRVECTGAGVAPFHARDARGEDEPEQVSRPSLEDGVGLRARERSVATDLTQPSEVVPLVEVERA